MREKARPLREKLMRFLILFDVRRFLKFGVIGVLNTLVDFACYYLMNKVLGAGPYLSQVVSFAVSAVHSFLWNKFWTFEKKASISGRELFRCLLTNGGYLLLSLLLLRFFINVLAMDSFLAKIPSGVLMLLYNYLMSKFWVFSDKTRPT
ncbi:MAG: GtrA family protein [Oscillospiraceae bacterium]|nr:GtrA family protein [Oscillospiraceae bacterium]